MKCSVTVLSRNHEVNFKLSTEHSGESATQRWLEKTLSEMADASL